SVFGHGTGPAVTGDRASAHGKMLDRFGRLVGGIKSGDLGKPSHMLRRGGFETATWIPRVEGLPVDGGHVALSVLRVKDKHSLTGPKSDAPLKGRRSGAFKVTPEYAVAAWAERCGGRLTAKQAKDALKSGRVTTERVWARTPKGLRRSYRVTAPNG